MEIALRGQVLLSFSIEIIRPLVCSIIMDEHPGDFLRWMSLHIEKYAVTKLWPGFLCRQLRTSIWTCETDGAFYDV